MAMRALIGTFGKTVTTFLTLAVTTTIAASVGIASAPGQQDPQAKSRAALQQARAIAFEVRAGRVERAGTEIVLIDEAIASDPNNAALWIALSGAYFNQLAASASSANGNPGALLAQIQRAAGAIDHALAIEPDNPEALASHGAGLTLNALFQQKPDLAVKGMAEMQRAVELSPSNVPVRLIRAFFGVNVARNLRDSRGITDDLTYLMSIAGNSRAGDMLHILLGDLHAEEGRADMARIQYQAVAQRTLSPVKEQGAARLAALDGGGVAAVDIALVRGSLGTRCTMCHAK
jgi:hypothetical protein